MTTRTQMASEIAEQPEALAGTLDALRPLRSELAALARGTRLVLFYARGSSGPGLPEALAPPALIVLGQLLTEALARRRGLNPDQPRTLSKVTQTSG